MQISILSKSKLRQIFFVLVSIAIVAMITVPYYDYYCIQTNQSTVMGDFNVLGSSLSGKINIDFAVGHQFTFIGDRFNVSIPCESSSIHSLQVMKDKEQNSALFDTEIFNASGKLDIVATHIELVSYQIVEENSTAVLSCQNQNLSSSLMSSERLQPSIVLFVDAKNSNSATLSTVEKTSSIFLGFGAKNGSLSIVGDNNISLPLISGYMGILLNVSTSINRSYHTRILGNFKEVYVENWETLKCIFLRDISESGTFSIYSPTGSLSYNDKEFQAKGSQDLVFKKFSGVVYLTPSTDPYFFRTIVNGDVASVIKKTSYTSSNLTEKNFLDPIPIPISSFTIALFLVLRKITQRIEVNILIPTLLFFLGFIAWSIETEQPMWVQNFFGYVPLFVSVITFFISTRQNKNKKS